MGLKQYTHPLLTGEPCMVEETFISSMGLICFALNECNLTMSINSSFRLDSDHIQGVVVEPARKSNHFVGHAIDGNLYDATGKEWTNEMMLGELTGDVLKFIELIRKYNLRWGGDFHKRDAIHYDSGLNLNNWHLWLELYNQLHTIP